MFLRLVLYGLLVTTILTVRVEDEEILPEFLEEKNPTFTNKIAVELDEDDESLAAQIAREYNLKNNGRIGSLERLFEFEHEEETGNRQRRSLMANLKGHPRVKAVDRQYILKRFKRSYEEDQANINCGEGKELIRLQRENRIKDKRYFRDPEFKKQWYIHNTGQQGLPFFDINVLPVYKKGITGKGIVVAVLDDGLDHTHPDLKRNFDRKASINLNKRMKDEKDDLRPEWDPFPRDTDDYNAHGTKCAGEIAAQANNDICGAGIAPNVKIGGVRMLDGTATDTLEAKALSFKRNYIDIYSNCWGPKDDGKTYGRPGKHGMKALADGAKYGRKGLGSIYVWATGNGGLMDDDCNCDGYTSSIYTISIGAVSAYGLSTYYDEKCASTMAVMFTGDTHRGSKADNPLVTTDLHHKCTETFRGTSSAAPLAAGVFALVLEANPGLSWRDMQHILVRTARNTSSCDPGWKKNGAGLYFNHKFGFGRIDAHAMVNAAEKWKNVPEQHTCVVLGSKNTRKNQIPTGKRLTLNFYSSGCRGKRNNIRKLEHVQLLVSLKHRRRGDLSITLTSPYGTKSKFLSTRRYDDHSDGLSKWMFMSVHFWGENPLGKWKVTFSDNPYSKYERKSLKKDVEDIERTLIDNRRKAHRDEILGDYDYHDEIHHGRRGGDYMRDGISKEDDVRRMEELLQDEIQYDIYDMRSPIAGYIKEIKLVFRGTGER